MGDLIAGLGWGDAKQRVVELIEAHVGPMRAAYADLMAPPERIEAVLPKGGYLVALDERGTDLTTMQLSQQLTHWQQQGRDVTFIIGGADGTAAQLRQDADLLLGLSAFTLPHGLCRVMLAEQLYRAVSLLAGHPYHRE